MAQAGRQSMNRRPREEEYEDEGDDEDEDEDDDGIPDSWRETLAQDALRQATSPSSSSLSECYLSGSMPKISASKRQKVNPPPASRFMPSISLHHPLLLAQQTGQ